MKKQKIAEKSKMLEGLNPSQEKAVTHASGPLLIIAGAGTGKTTVLTRRITYLIEQSLAKPDEILALTFTVKATGEMQDRVDELMPLGYQEMAISTFDAFAEKILRQHALDIGLPGDFKILDDTQAWILMRNHIYDFNLDYYKPKGNPGKFIHALLRHFETAKREGVTPEKYLEYAQGLQMNLDNIDVKKKAKKKKNEAEELDAAEISRIAEVANAFHFYQKLLLDNSYLDFRDLIGYTRQLFATRPKILKFYQEKFKYILVDEFQDTDLAQYELVKLLALPQNNLTVVGDDDQSIYKFRGASVSNILKFIEDYPDASEVTLTDNYRSAQNILDLSYGFIQKNDPERLEAKLKISKKLTSHFEGRGVISVLHAADMYGEAKQTVDKIVELHEAEGLDFNSFAILVRANDHAEVFLNELSRRFLPYVYVASKGLFRKPLILDLLAYMQLLSDFHQNDFFFRVLNLPKFRMDHEDLILVSHTANKKTLSIYEVLKGLPAAVKINSESQTKAFELLRLLERHCKLALDLPVTELFIRIIEDLGVKDSLTNDSLESVQNQDLLLQFYRKIQDFAEDATDKTLKNFLQEIAFEQQAGDSGTLLNSPESGPEAIKVMTIHAAKGLEFVCVFLTNMVEARFPSRDRKEQIELPNELVKEILPVGDEHIMEERRLFYVAATRAKKYLFFTWADDYGGAFLKKPSQFLLEAGLEQRRSGEKPSGEVFFAKQQALAIELPKHKFRPPEAFDYSQISAFRKCPLEYKYKYLYKLPMPGAPALSFGSTMHNALKKFLTLMKQVNNLKQGDLFGTRPDKISIPPLETLEKFYAESWVDDWYLDQRQKAKYRADGLRYLQNCYAKISEDPKMPDFIEQSFWIRLGKYKFKGRIDRSDLNLDGTVDIIDYKSGEKARTKIDPVDKEQLLIYQWAAEEGFNKKVKNLSYWDLADLSKVIFFKGKPEEISQLKQRLLDSIEEIVYAIETNNFLAADLRKSHECKFRHLE